MRHLIWYLLSVYLLLAGGCGRAQKTPLQATAGKLKPDMSHSEVDQLFSDFRGGGSDEYHTNVQALLHYSGDEVLFRTNINRGCKVGYYPGGFFSAWEICTVFFDDSDKVVGYSYIREGYKERTNQ